MLVQWGLVRRRWLQATGEEDLTRWPWITTVVAGLAILNPFGLAIFAAALKRDPTGDWLWHLSGRYRGGLWHDRRGRGAGGIECYIRGRILRRREPAPGQPRA